MLKCSISVEKAHDLAALWLKKLLFHLLELSQLLHLIFTFMSSQLYPRWKSGIEEILQTSFSVMADSELSA